MKTACHRGRNAQISPCRTETRAGAVLCWGMGGTCHLSLVAPPPPPIQKLADRSDVISEVPKCSKIQILGAYSAPSDL